MKQRNSSADTRKRAGYRVYFDLADGKISVQHEIAADQATATVLQHFCCFVQDFFFFLLLKFSVLAALQPLNFMSSLPTNYSP